MAALLSGSAYAATQGILGATSFGTSLITAGKANAVRITGITDLTFPNTATVPTPLSDSVCVYATAGSYTIRASSGNAVAGVFNLKSTGAALIKYAVGWANLGTGGTATALTSGTASPSQTGASTTAQDCGGTTTARFEVTVDAVTFDAAPAGAYTDTLTLMVAPV